MQKSRITAIALILVVAAGLCAFATRAHGSSVAQVASPSTMTLAGTFWQAVVVGDKNVSSFGIPGPYLVFEATTGRVIGSDGCNRLAGDFAVNGDVVTFARLESTHGMCVGGHSIQRRFDRALSEARRVVIVGNQLELLDTSNKPLVIFRPAL